MAVLHVLGYAGTAGRAFGISGVERVVETLLEGLGRADFRQYVVYPEAGQLLERFRSGAHDLLALEPKGRFDAGYVRALVEFIQRHDIRVVLSMGLRFDFLSGMACRRLGVPHIVHRPVALADEPISALRKRLYGIPDRWTLRHCKEIVACSRASAETMLRTQGVAAQKITVVHNGVDLRQVATEARQRARRALGIDDDAFLVGGVGQLIARKGFEIAIEAIARIKPRDRDVPLVLLGEGPERDRLQKRAQERQVHLLLPGFVEDPYPLIAGFDAAVLPSSAEGMPLVVLESMSLGVPTIATAVAGTPEVIEDGDSGLLVTPGDVAGLATALEQLLEDPQLCRRIGLAGAERIRQHFSLETMLQGFRDCLQRNARSYEA